MALPKVCGIETEYGIVVRGAENNPVSASSLLINAYIAATTSPQRGRVGWDFDDEHPANDARGFSLDDIIAPEIETTLVNAANFTQTLLGNGGNGPLRFDLTPFQSPQVANEAALLDKVDLILFGGAMSDGTRTILTTALADPDFPSASPNQRTLTLLWLASMTPESVVQK